MAKHTSKRRRWRKAFNKQLVFGGKIKTKEEVQKLHSAIVAHEKREFSDFEIDGIGDIDTTSQFEQTEIKWYRRNSSFREFELVYSYNDHDNNLNE